MVNWLHTANSHCALDSWHLKLIPTLLNNIHVNTVDRSQQTPSGQHIHNLLTIVISFPFFTEISTIRRTFLLPSFKEVTRRRHVERDLIQ